MTKADSASPWISSPLFDGLLIVGPAFFVSIGCLVLFEPGPAVMRAELPLTLWLLFVLGIDVAHVYSTLFRTYLDPEERERYQVHLWAIPILCWAVGALLYAVGPIVFWSLLAYAAVFHFVRQQYGFYALYARYDRESSRLSREIETAAVYLATLYPLAYWHEHLPRAFVWFIEGDFWLSLPQGTSTIMGWLLVTALLLHCGKELLGLYRRGSWNLPKNLVIWGTALAWYVGIVHFDGDVPFTITNVTAHGIPYIALIWLFGRRKVARARPLPPLLARCFTPLGALGFIGALVVLAFVEETLWDALVWQERAPLFGWAWVAPQIEERKVLAILVPLLAVPQATHYVLDAFIWRIRKPTGEVSHLLFVESGSGPTPPVAEEPGRHT